MDGNVGPFGRWKWRRTSEDKSFLISYTSHMKTGHILKGYHISLFRLQQQQFMFNYMCKHFFSHSFIIEFYNWILGILSGNLNMELIAIREARKMLSVICDPPINLFLTNNKDVLPRIVKFLDRTNKYDSNYIYTNICCYFLYDDILCFLALFCSFRLPGLSLILLLATLNRPRLYFKPKLWQS